MPVKASVEDIDNAPNLDEHDKEEALLFLQTMGTGVWKCHRADCGNVWIAYGYSVQQGYCSDACKQAAYRARRDNGNSNQSGLDDFVFGLFDEPDED